MKPDGSRAVSIDQVKEQIAEQVGDVTGWVLTCGNSSFLEFEQQLIPECMNWVGCLFHCFYGCVKEIGKEAIDRLKRV